MVTVGEAKVRLLGQDLPVPLPLDPQGDLERYRAWAVEAARIVDGDLAAAEVALRAVRARYQVLVGTQDVLHRYQNNCSTFLEWQMARRVPEDLGELRDVRLPLDDNDLPLT